MKERNLTIDVAKGLTIILMLVGHCDSISHGLFKLIFSFHMPLFFILSGYFFKQKNTRQLAKNDFRKLVVPYMMTIMATALFATITPPISLNSFWHKILGGFYGCIGSYRMILPSHTLNCHAGPEWFLLSIFWCRLYFNVLFQIKKEYYLLLSFALFLLFWLLGMLIVNIPLCIGSGFTGLLFYAMGVKLKEKGLTDYSWLQYGVFVFVWLFAAYYGSINMSQYNYMIGPGTMHNILSFPVSIMGALCGTLVICKISMMLKGGVKNTFAVIGTYTLEILCGHSIAFSCRSIFMNSLSLDVNDVLMRDVSLVFLSVLISIIIVSFKTIRIRKKKINNI